MVTSSPLTKPFGALVVIVAVLFAQVAEMMAKTERVSEALAPKISVRLGPPGPLSSPTPPPSMALLPPPPMRMLSPPLP